MSRRLPRAELTLLWDLPLRLFHWLLVLVLAASWASAEAGFDWTPQHFWSGYVAISLVLFRLIWGFVGPHHARFSNFVTTPKGVWRYLQDAKPFVGHNPLGGWSVLLMLLLVAVQALTGLFISDDIFYAGPYNPVVSAETAGTLAAIHHNNFMLLQAVVVIHLMAIAWYVGVKKQPLIKPMITGKRSGLDPADQIASSMLIRGALVLLIVTAVVFTAVNLAPEPVVEDYY